MLLRDPLMYRIRREHHYRTRRRLVHLPDLRLGPRPVRLDRGHHPLDLHARVRGPPAALRLVPRPARHPPSPGRSSSPASTSATPSSASAGSSSSSRRASSTAGTTRACRPSPASGGAATRPRRSGISPTSSASPRTTASSTWPCSRCCVREDLNRTAPRAMAVLRPLKVVIDQLPRGPGRGARRRQQPRGPERRERARSPSPASSTSSATTSWRTRRTKFFRLAPGPGGPPPLRLFHHLPGGRQGPRDRRGRRAPLHLRPGDARRRRARRPEGQGDPPLGFGGPRRRRRGPALRHALHRARPLRDVAGRGGLESRPQPEVARGPARGQARAVPGVRGRPRAAGSSSGWAISAPTGATRSPAGPSSTGP